MNKAREIETRGIETTYPALELRRAVLRDEVEQPLHNEVDPLLGKQQGFKELEVILSNQPVRKREHKN